MKTLSTEEIQTVSGGLAVHPVIDWAILFGAGGVLVNILTHNANITTDIVLKGLGYGAGVGALYGLFKSA